METGTGTGSAYNATASVAELEDALREAREREEGTLLERNVAAAEAKITKIEGHLADAKEALKTAKAELAAAQKGN